MGKLTELGCGANFSLLALFKTAQPWKCSRNSNSNTAVFNWHFLHFHAVRHRFRQM